MSRLFTLQQCLLNVEFNNVMPERVRVHVLRQSQKYEKITTFGEATFEVVMALKVT